MRVSYAWLQEFVEIDRAPEELADTLTMGGLEVGALDDWRGRATNVRVARITAIRPHSKADRLRVCTVDSGAQLHTVVCGADNIALGQVAPLALPGARLPNGMTIEETEIRGEPSEGMLCSSVELDLGRDAEGILILPEQTQIGQSFIDLLELDDVIFEIDLTPNRADCLSILGVAREVAALCQAPFHEPQVRLTDDGAPISSLTSIAIDAPDLCPRYAARIIQDVRIGPSPVWMQVRLHKLGLRPINNIVDATNYVLMERGQPLHAFDLDRLAEQRIVVRRAVAGERFTTLDGVERRMSGEMLMIADGARNVAVAGVMGGQNSEVSDETRNVLIESAYFTPTSVRRTSKQLGLRTEASHRFERGIDPNVVVKACDRSAQLMADLAGGRIAAGVADVYPSPIMPRPIKLRVARINHVLGTNLRKPAVRRALKALQFDYREEPKRQFTVSAPTYRPDLTREIDLIEEVARLHGFNNIPTSLPLSPLAEHSPPTHRPLECRLREVLVACGLAEAISYSFINPLWIEHLGLDRNAPRGRPVPLSNPLSGEQSVLRTMLLPGLLDSLQRNISRQQTSSKLFEYGTVFIAAAQNQKQSEAQPAEERHLALAICGARQALSWTSQREMVNFFDIKGIVEQMASAFQVSSLALEPTEETFLHPQRALAIRCGGTAIGVLGEMHPDVLDRFDLPVGVFVLELQIKPFFAASTPVPTFTEAPRYPASQRDLAILVGESLPAAEVEAAIRKIAPVWLREITLFDSYRGKSIPAGKKSLAYSLTFQTSERTLTDAEVNEQFEAILASLSKQFQATLRPA